MTRRRFALLLREARTRAGLTQVEVARKLGQPQSYVSKYEQGEQRLDLIELEAVCKAMGVPLIEMVRRYVES